MFNLLTPLTSVYVRTGAVKPVAVRVTNLPTYPSVETRIGAAASVDAAMFSRDVFVSSLMGYKTHLSSITSFNK